MEESVGGGGDGGGGRRDEAGRTGGPSEATSPEVPSATLCSYVT